MSRATHKTPGQDECFSLFEDLHAQICLNRSLVNMLCLAVEAPDNYKNRDTLAGGLYILQERLDQLANAFDPTLRTQKIFP